MNEEFDRCLPGSEENPSDSQSKRRVIPNDFLEEERAFVQELDDFFELDKEDIPPYFVQTLLASEDIRFQPTDPEFEKRICARVFRQLELHYQPEPCHQLKLPRQPEPCRSLHHPHRAPTRTPANVLTVSRPFTAVAVACMLFMLVTMLITSTAFASGLSLLFSGKHSGVVQVSKHPSNVSASFSPHFPQSSSKGEEPKLSMQDTQLQLQFQMSWLPWTPENYVLKNAYLYQGVDQRLADGPALELDYGNASGNGKITIYEFKPIGRVFQVVQSGAAHQVIVYPEKSFAISVDGQWKNDKSWVYGERSELIYERDGVIFWIVGNQHDGINSDALRSLASSLQVFDVMHAMHMGNYFGGVTQSTDTAPVLFANDIVSASGGPDGPFFSIAGAAGANLPSYTLR